MVKSCVLNVRVGIHQKLTIEHLGYASDSAAVRDILDFFEFAIPNEYKRRVLRMCYRERDEFAKMVVQFMNKNV